MASEKGQQCGPLREKKAHAGDGDHRDGSEGLSDADTHSGRDFRALMAGDDPTDIEIEIGQLATTNTAMTTECEVLLVDDNPADIDLTKEALRKSKRNFHVNAVGDGSEAISFLRRQGKFAQAPIPDLIVLDLNLPGRDGHDVLLELKCDPGLFGIPVVVLTSSEAASDITRSYELGANCYLRKPGNLHDFIAAVQSMADFWLGFASLPHKEQ